MALYYGDFLKSYPDYQKPTWATTLESEEFRAFWERLQIDPDLFVVMIVALCETAAITPRQPGFLLCSPAFEQLGAPFYFKGQLSDEHNRRIGEAVERNKQSPMFEAATELFNRREEWSKAHGAAHDKAYNFMQDHPETDRPWDSLMEEYLAPTRQVIKDLNERSTPGISAYRSYVQWLGRFLCEEIFPAHHQPA